MIAAAAAAGVVVVNIIIIIIINMKAHSNPLVSYLDHNMIQLRSVHILIPCF
jgi:hypothetical protein